MEIRAEQKVVDSAMSQIMYIPRIHYFVDRICTPTWVIDRQLIDFHDLTYIAKGRGEYVLDGVTYCVSDGDLIYIPPGILREAKTDPEDAMHLFAFNMLIFDADFRPSRLPFPLHCHIGPDAKTEHLMLRIKQVFAMREATCQMQSSALFMELVSHLLLLTGFVRGAASDPRVQKAAAYVMENISRHISSDEIGRAAGVHPGYLNKLTVRSTGKSVSRFVTSIRVNMAEDALTFEGISVREAAERFGFSDIFHFSKVFKKYKGYPPSAAKNAIL